MKKCIFIVLILLIFSINGKSPELTGHVKDRYIENIQNFVEHTQFINYIQDEFERFLIDLAVRESSLIWYNYNKWGYIGLWQFGKSALKETGYDHITFRNFVSFPDIFCIESQVDAVTKLILINYQRLYGYIKEHEFSTYEGNIITESGFIAAAHIAGAFGVKRFFDTNGLYNPKDALGTKLSDYLVNFSKYDFELDKISHPNASNISYKIEAYIPNN